MPLTEPTRLVLKKDPVLADPYYHNVSLLLHGDGANGSTTIVDSSPSPKTVTAVGDAQISTAQSKFGGSSLAFDGSGDWLVTLNDNAFNFGEGDFTIEAWIYTKSQSLPFSSVVATGRSSFNSGAVFFMNYGVNTSADLKRKMAFGTFEQNPIVLGTTLINLDQWYHVAVSRSGNVVRLFVDGILESTALNSQAINLSYDNLQIGRNGWNGAAGHFNGYIDDLRITKGVARYTTNFTPPTAPFPEVIG